MRFYREHVIPDFVEHHSVLTADTAGSFYGTTQRGGTGFSGMVFNLNKNGKEKAVLSFCDRPPLDSSGPSGASAEVCLDTARLSR